MLVQYKKETNGFYQKLSERINQYFIENNISKYANTTWFIRAWIMVLGFITSIILLYLQLFPMWANAILCLVAGFFMAGIGTAIAHQASHRTISKNKIINRLWSLSFNLVGASDYMWHIKHDIYHHAYTNIFEFDEALKEGDVLRFNHDAPLKKMHKFQHLYGFFVYALFTIFWIFMLDFEKFFRYNRNGISKEKNHTLTEHAIFWITKIYYICIFIFLPYYLGFGVWEIVVGHLLMHAVAGIIVTHVLQVEHINMHSKMIEYKQQTEQPISWAQNQLEGTSNFKIKNKLLDWYIAGVNLQIEHHLFQQINAVHYPKLVPIIKETAAEYGYLYHEYENFWKAIKSHYICLKKLGQ